MATWSEVEAVFGHTPRRRVLLAGLREALVSLRQAGCETAYIDGSFVTAKGDPGDFDACWGAAGVDPELLNQRGRETGRAKGILEIDVGAIA